MYESGAINPNDVRSIDIAEKLYNQIRQRRTDYINVARNTRLSLEQCKIIKNYLFYDRHELSDGYKQFLPDIMMAQSWLRLSEKNGNNIQKHDVVMVYHELTEVVLLLTNTNMSQREAHNLAERKYNYLQASKQYYKSLGIII